MIRYCLYTPEPPLMWLWYNVRHFSASNNTIAAMMILTTPAYIVYLKSNESSIFRLLGLRKCWPAYFGAGYLGEQLLK